MPAGTNRPFHNRYWPVGMALALGLTISIWLARGLYRQAEELDEQRFDLETLILAQLIEGTMERYEERLARLADFCAEFDEMPASVWNFRQSRMTDLNHNLPSVMHVAYCLKINAADFESHVLRGRVAKGSRYAFDPQMRPDRELALPVWHVWSRAGFVPIQPGTDLAVESPTHPALAAGLGRVTGWVSPQPARVPRKDGGLENGFWFVLPIFKPDQKLLTPSRLPGESDSDRLRRDKAFHRSAAVGILAAFISADRMDQSVNQPRAVPRIHVRIYASPEPRPEALFSPNSQPPPKPRHRKVTVQPWYGRRWALEFASTPEFEAGSPRHRAWLLLLAGAGMTLLACATIGLGLRARHRQEVLTDQIREARDALAAAEQQRQRLSHDLHDNTVQTLYAIQLGLGHTSQKLESEPAHAQRELSTVRAELDAVIAEIRRFITAEEKTEIAADLSAVLHTLVARAKIGAKARLELHCDAAASRSLTGSEAVQLANIAREALSNSLRHGNSQRVAISLRLESGAVCLEISDDGAGFDPKARDQQGVGLASMASRAAELGGELKLQSSPGRGTRVVVRVPASPPANDEPE